MLQTKQTTSGLLMTSGNAFWTRTTHLLTTKRITPRKLISECKEILQKLASGTPLRSWTTSLKWTTYRRFASMYRSMSCMG